MINKEDQQKIINYLEGKRSEDSPIVNGAIGMIVALIQLGMLDHVISGGSTDEFSRIAIYQVSEYIDRLMMDERFSELMDEAIDNALDEEA